MLVERRYISCYAICCRFVMVTGALLQAQRGVLWAFAAWVLAVGHWLAWAYLLEFQGVPAHMGVWAAGVAFVAANVTLLCKLHTALRQPPHTRFSTDHSKEV